MIETRINRRTAAEEGIEERKKALSLPARHALTPTLSQWERETIDLQIAS